MDLIGKGKFIEGVVFAELVNDTAVSLEVGNDGVYGEGKCKDCKDYYSVLDEHKQQRHSRPKKDQLLLRGVTPRHFYLLFSNSPITAFTSILIDSVLRKTLEDSIGKSMLHCS